ncbi:MAG: hypothetical protein JO247_13920 [Chloroflexi bacterium]|nr:hypothetical protein [Chloroflexota bacterium]
MTSAPSRVRWETIALWAVLPLAAGLRLFRLNFAEYQWDDDSIWSLAVTALAHHTLPAEGIRSTIGAGNGPFQVYLMLPFAAISSSPLIGVAAIAVLNTAAVYFTYRFVAEFFGRRAGVIAALLFAANASAVIYSRHLAVQGMLIPFQVLFFWSVSRWLLRGRGIDLVLAFLWLAVASQTYIDGMLHLASMAALLALGWRRLRPLPLLAGGALWAALSAYYLVAALLPERGLIQASLHGSVLVDASSLMYAVAQALHTAFQVDAPQMDALLQPVSGLEAALTWLEGGVYVAGILYGAARFIRAHREGKPTEATALAVWFVWLLIPIAAYVRHQDIVTPRHLTLTLPLPAMFTALLLDRLWPRLGAPLLAAVSANGLGVAGAFLATIPTCATNNVYALPYQQTFDLAASVQRLAATSQTQTVYVLGRPSLGPILASILGRDGLDARWLDTNESTVLPLPPSGQIVYVTLDADSPAIQALAPSKVAEQPVPCEDMVFRSYAADRAALASAFTLPADLSLHSSDGLELDGLSAPRRLDGDPTVALSWHGQPAAPHTVFLHLLDSAGHQVAGADVRLTAAGVLWQTLPTTSTLIPGRYSLDLGVYDEQGTRLPLIDATGRAIGTDAVWAPLVVPPPADQPPGLTPAVVTFGGQIQLTGYRATASGVTLQWQALSVSTTDYTVFVHAIDGAGRIVVQADGEPRGGDFPTSAWRPGDHVADEHPWILAPGSYTLEVGLYELSTLQRLPGGPLEVPLIVP